jgi:hypothetical protein
VRHVLQLVAILVMASMAQAAPNMSVLQGSYVLDDPSAMENIETAVDRVADRMGFLVAGIARGRLMDANKPAQRIFISVAGNEVTTQLDQDQAIRTSANGATVDWTRDNGEKVRVTTSWQGGVLRRSVASKEATRTNSFSLAPDGDRLIFGVEIVSRRLPAPVTYQLTYRRSSQE